MTKLNFIKRHDGIMTKNNGGEIIISKKVKVGSLRKTLSKKLKTWNVLKTFSLILILAQNKWNRVNVGFTDLFSPWNRLKWLKNGKFKMLTVARIKNISYFFYKLFFLFKKA